MKKSIITLIALAGVAGAAGTGEFSVSTAGNFYAGNYGFDFTIGAEDVTYNDGIIVTLNGGTVLALYGTYSGTEYYTNAFVFGVADGAITLSVGRGSLYGLPNSNSSILPTTGYTFGSDSSAPDSGVFKNGDTPLTLSVGTTYHINNVVIDGMQNVSIFQVGGSSEALATVVYKGNMSGGNTSTVMSVWGNTVYNVVPEPATATLSLLALCGLAARRRRK